MKAIDNLGYLQNTMREEAIAYGKSRAGRLMMGCSEAIKQERAEMSAYYMAAEIRAKLLDDILGSRAYRILKVLHLIP